MRFPGATKGHKNLFVTLVNRKKVDGSTLCSYSGCIGYAPKSEVSKPNSHIIAAFLKKWCEVSPFSSHAEQYGSS